MNYKHDVCHSENTRPQFMPFQVITKNILTFSLLVSVLSACSAIAQEIDTGTSLPPALQKVDVLYKQGRLDAAKSILDGYLQQDSRNIQALLRKAHIEIQSGHYTQAEAILNNALVQNSNRVDVLAVLGELYYYQAIQAMATAGTGNTKLAQAEQYLQQALAIRPDHVASLSTLGLVRLAQQDSASAEQLLRQALAINPNSVLALQGLTRFYIQAKDWTHARYTVNQALELDPNNQSLYFLAAQLLATADFPADAIQYAQKSEALDFGRNAERDLLIAKQYEKLGEFEKAIPYHQKILQTNPKFSESWQRLGALYADTNQSDKSQQAYKMALKIDPSWFEKLQETMIHTLREGNPKGAIAQIKDIIKIKPELRSQYEAILANIQYALTIAENLKKQNSPFPLLQLPSGNPDSWEQTKQDLGQAGYIAGFLLPNQDNGSQILISFTNSSNGITQTEALFLSGQFQKSKQTLEEYSENLSASDYALLGDRLVLLKDLRGAQLTYQRSLSIYRLDGIEMNSPSTQSVQHALQNIDSLIQQSDQSVKEGDRQFDVKAYDQAVLSYLKALQTFPANETAYLRLADTFPRIKIKKPKKGQPPGELNKDNLPVLTFWAYQQATQLNPNLMDSKGFSKELKKTENKSNAKQAKDNKNTTSNQN